MSTVSKIVRKIIIITRRFYITIFCKNINIGKGLNFRRGFDLNCSKTGKIRIGNRCFFNNYCSLNAHENIEIGNDCIFGEGVKIYDHNHRFDMYNVPIFKQGFRMAPISIGDNCWIGSNVIILPGTTIGCGTVVGAGCIIKGNIEKNSVVKNDIKNNLLIEEIHYKD